MSNISLNAIGKIETETVELIAAVDRVASGLAIPYFVAGACARDVVLGSCYGLPVGEATRDVDFAFLMEGWEQYSTLADRLTTTGEFEADSKVRHRFIYQSTYVLDLIPFGGIEDPPGRIVWPPDFAFAMSMYGFREAYERALAVIIAPDLVVRFASPDGLMLLKLFAWRDRGRETHRKDARDIALLLGNYLDAGNLPRLYEEHA